MRCAWAPPGCNRTVLVLSKAEDPSYGRVSPPLRMWAAARSGVMRRVTGSSPKKGEPDDSDCRAASAGRPFHDKEAPRGVRERAVTDPRSSEEQPHAQCTGGPTLRRARRPLS